MALLPRQPSSFRLCGFVWSDGLLDEIGGAAQRGEDYFFALSHKSLSKHPSFSNCNAAGPPSRAGALLAHRLRMSFILGCSGSGLPLRLAQVLLLDVVEDL
jgi:hypothetical protein